MTVLAGEGGTAPSCFVTWAWKHIWECIFLEFGSLVWFVFFCLVWFYIFFFFFPQRDTLNTHQLLCHFYFSWKSSTNPIWISEKSGHPKLAFPREFAEREVEKKKKSRSLSNDKTICLQELLTDDTRISGWCLRGRSLRDINSSLSLCNPIFLFYWYFRDSLWSASICAKMDRGYSHAKTYHRDAVYHHDLDCLYKHWLGYAIQQAHGKISTFPCKDSLTAICHSHVFLSLKQPMKATLWHSASTRWQAVQQKSLSKPEIHWVGGR